MPDEDIATAEARAIGRKLIEVLGEAAVEKTARRCGFLRRRREIAPVVLLVASISALGAGAGAWLADILRTFNAFTGKAVRYKPFHNQISKTKFPVFVHAILEQLLAKLTGPVLEGVPKDKLARFEEVLIHDGTHSDPALSAPYSLLLMIERRPFTLPVDAALSVVSVFVVMSTLQKCAALPMKT